jgi:hypothetical protein
LEDKALLEPLRKGRLIKSFVPKARYLAPAIRILEAAVGLRDLRPAHSERHSNPPARRNRRLHGYRYSTLA